MLTMIKMIICFRAVATTTPPLWLLYDNNNSTDITIVYWLPVISLLLKYYALANIELRRFPIVLGASQLMV